MLIKPQADLKYSDITPKGVYLGRRNFLSGLLATTGAVAGWMKFPKLASAQGMGQGSTTLGALTKSRYSIKEEPTISYLVTHYNNFYEFGTEKEDPAQNSRNFRTSPWTVAVEGEVAKPRT